MKALILAAGFGTRLYPLSAGTPKALIKVSNKPIIEYQIEKLKTIQEIDKIYILSNNKFYTDFLEWADSYKKDSNIRIKILNNGINHEYETIGAIKDFKSSLDFIGEDDLFLLACDNIFEFDLKELKKISKEKNSSAAALKICENKELIKKYNSILLDHSGKITSYEEKPREPASDIFSTACYLLKKEDLKIIKAHDFQNKDNFGEILSFLHKESSVYGKIFYEFWIDIGSKEELEKARQHFISNSLPGSSKI